MTGTPHARRLHMKLYVAGLRVPVRSATVNGSPNSHVSAAIEIPPGPLATSIQPRTPVHVVVKKSVEEPYELLFEGEYVAYSLHEDTGSKGFVMQCVGLTNYWETIYQYFIEKLAPASVGGNEIATFVSGGPLNEPRVMTAIPIATPQVFGDYVVQALTKDNRSVQVAIMNALSLMANMNDNQNGNVLSPRINSQIERAYVNLRLGERVAMLPDTAIEKLVDTSLDMQVLLQKFSGQLSGFATMASIVTTFLQLVYYDWVPLIAPPYTLRNTKPPEGTGGALDFFRPVAVKAGSSEGGFRSTRSSITSLPDFGETIASASQLSAADRTTLTALSKAQGKGRVFDVTHVQRDVVFKPKTFFLPPPTCNLVFPCQFDRFNASRAFLQEPTRLRLRVQGLPGLDPAVNDFSSLSYYAPYALETALDREGLTSNDVASTAVLTEDLLKTEDKSAVQVKRYETLISDPGGSIDENITGVVPAFEEMGFAEYASLYVDPKDRAGALGQEKAASTAVFAELQELQEFLKKAREKHKVTTSANADVHQYMSYIAQYKLEVQRSAPRSINGVSGPYNPNLVLGFPALVFSKTAIFSGELVSLNHSLQAQGAATTTFSLGMVRELSLLPGVSIGTSDELSMLEEALIKVGQAEIDKAVVPTAESVKRAVRQVSADRESVLSKDRADILVDGFDPVDKFPDQPDWLSYLYRPTSIADEVYKPLLGDAVGSSLSLIPRSVDEGGHVDNQVLAANIIYLRYLQADDRVAFADTLTKRPITTASQCLKDFLGLAKEPSDALPDRGSGPFMEDLTEGLGLGIPVKSQKAVADDAIIDPFSPFLKSQVEAVRQYVTIMSKTKGFRG